MKVEELRIGNITSHGTVYKIEQETDLDFKDQIGCMDNLGGIGMFDFDEIQPVKNSMSYLSELGFTECDNQDFDLMLNISASKLYVRKNGFHLFFQFNETYLGEIFPYVHQLQNFCAIFNKQLTIP